MNDRRWRSPWLWAILFGLGCSAVAYGLHWHHGPHHDDYFFYNMSFRSLLGMLHYEIRPVGKLFGAVIYSLPEIVARIFSETMLIGTAVLAGLLVYRLSGVYLAAVSVVLLCLVPVEGAEATVWVSALIHFMPAGFFALLAINTFLSSLRAAGRPHRGRLLALISGVLLVLAFGSIEPAANFYVLFIGILLAEAKMHPQDSHYMKKMLGLATLVIVISGALIYVVFYVDASQVSRRGSFEIPSLARVVGFLMGYLDRSGGGPFGRELIGICFSEGWVSLLSSRTASLLACATVAAAAGLNLFWKTETAPARLKRDLPPGTGILMAACLTTTVASMLLPSVLLSREPGSARLAYLPGISGMLFLGFGIAWLATRSQAKLIHRSILAAVTICALVATVFVSGYTRMYQLRYAYDRLQLAALERAVPPESAAGRNIVFLPYAIYENFLGYRTGMNQNYFLIGGFSSPNSIGTILERAYPHTRIDVIRPGYGDFRWSIILGRARTLLLSGYEGDPPREAVPDDLILFRFCKGGTVELAREIRFVSGNGAVKDIVSLPWADRLHEKYGTRTFVLVRQSRGRGDTDSVGREKVIEKVMPIRSPYCELVDELPPDMKKPVAVNYGNKIRLLGISAAKLSKERMKITYYWRQTDRLGQYDTVFVHFTDDDNRMLFQGDHLFCEKRPFSELNGRVAKETQFLDVPSAAEGKKISVMMGIYNPSSKDYDRLKIESAAGVEREENNAAAIVGILR